MATLTAKRVVTGLSRPVFATAPPGDAERLFLVEQHSGLIKILQLATGQIKPTPLLHVKGVTTGNEQGLLGLAFHPQYASNGFFYVNCTLSIPPNAPNVTTVIRRYKVSDADPNVAAPDTAATVLTIAQPEFGNHKCGWLAFSPKNSLLYIGTGDGGSANDPGKRAQNLGELLGKMLRIDMNGDDFPSDANRNYRIPPDNPFVKRQGARPEIWAFGLRNPWRDCFDRMNGDLYIADVGQDHFEEVNFQPASSRGGENYGWRAKEGLHKNPNLNDSIPAGVTDPIHEYDHDTGSAIVGGYVYRGAKIAGLQGTYFFGDFDGKIWSFRYDSQTKTKSDETERTSQLLPNGVSGGLSSFGEDGAGELYFLDLSGVVIQIVAAP